MICNGQMKLHTQRNNCVAPPPFCLIIDILYRKTPVGGSRIVRNVGETVPVSDS